MKLSKETIEVLKNFSGINQSIVVNKGNKLKTVNSLKNILAHAKVGRKYATALGTRPCWQRVRKPIIKRGLVPL